VAKYTADIEIAVRGGQQVNGLIKGLNRLNNSINVVDRNAKLLQGKNFNVASMENYSRAVSKAERALRQAAEGTKQESDAVTGLVTAINIENKARERRNFLIAQEVANRRKVIATANAGVGVQGPLAAPVKPGRGPASPLRGTATMPGSPAALSAVERRGRQNRLGEALGGGIIGGAFPLLFGQGGGAATGGAIGGVLGGLAGPGGSFAGSLLGTLIGDIASKGQTIKDLGTDLGFSAQQANLLAVAFKTANTDVEKFTSTIQNIRGVGLDLEDQADAINLITSLTEKYGGTWDKIGNAITSSLESGKVTQANLNQLTSQGITIQDALARKYGVSRDAILQMAKDGDISVQTLLDTLVDLGNESTTAAKKVETPFQKAIGETVNLFQDFWSQVQAIFSGVSGEGSEAATVLVKAFNTWLKEVLFPIGRLLARIAALLVNVVSTGVNAATELVTSFRGVASAIADAFMNIVNMIPGLRTIVGLAGQLLNKVTGRRSSDWNDMPWPEGVPKPGSPGMVGRITAPSQLDVSKRTKQGRKPPESRVAELKNEYDALLKIGGAENAIRDLLFEKKEIQAAYQELAKSLYIIEKERVRAIDRANYAEEKLYINKIAQEKSSQAIAASEDKIRAINKRRADEFAAILRGVETEIRFTDARINNTEDQAIIEQKINDLVRDRGYILDSQVEKYRQLLELANQRRDAEELSVIQKQIDATGKGLQAGFIGPAGAAFEQQLAAGKPVERATEVARLTEELQIAEVQAQALESSVLAIGQAFGTAMTTGVAELIKGTKSAQQVFAEFLENVANALLDAAATMIATYVAIGVAKIFAGMGTNDADPLKGVGGADWMKYTRSNADGNVYASNGVVPFANGGMFTNSIVSSPTLFQFAGGGVTQAGLMGEAGPEAIMPLKRGADGKLGVQVADNRAFLDALRGDSPENGTASDSPEELATLATRASIREVERLQENRTQIMTQQMEAERRYERERIEQMASTPGNLNIRYESQVINNVEYVTRDQAERMAAQSALRGRELAIGALQNSVKTRKRVGI
jgi:tape measure domain-containing protein